MYVHFMLRNFTTCSKFTVYMYASLLMLTHSHLILTVELHNTRFVVHVHNAISLTVHVFSHNQLLLNINFSSRTTSMDVQRNIEANVEKRTKDTYGPPPGKRLLIFIDDMNMPQVRHY